MRTENRADDYTIPHVDARGKTRGAGGNYTNDTTARRGHGFGACDDPGISRDDGLGICRCAC